MDITNYFIIFFVLIFVFLYDYLLIINMRITRSKIYPTKHQEAKKENFVQNSSDLFFVEKILFINLNERKDRLKQIQEELAFIPEDKIIRFEAIKNANGNLGCTKSHIACLNLAIKNNWKNVLILEDDAKWNNYDKSSIVFENIYREHPDFDVITLGNVGASFDKKTYKLYSGQTTTAYFVNGHYYETLRDKFMEGERELEKITKDTTNEQKVRIENSNAVDQIWKQLQSKDNWYIVNPALMIQRPSNSSILGGFVDYKSYFNT